MIYEIQQIYKEIQETKRDMAREDFRFVNLDKNINESIKVTKALYDQLQDLRNELSYRICNGEYDKCYFCFSEKHMYEGYVKRVGL